jgi:hypothetical protein
MNVIFQGAMMVHPIQKAAHEFRNDGASYSKSSS